MHVSPLEMWIQRIKKLLNFQQNQPPTIPWLLVPFENEELSEHEISQLFKTLRNIFFGYRHGTPMQQIRKSIQKFSADERLVFLYALRLVAANGGSNNRFWTLCHEQLFNKMIHIDELRIILASEISELWLGLYHATDGLLFFPQVGKRHIKWPLAHAGLLQRHKRELQRFHMCMRETWSWDEFQLLTHPDNFDDFCIELEDWLNTQCADSDLRSILRTEERGTITFELAQQYLSSLPNEPIESKPPELQAVTPLRRTTRRFRLNLVEQCLELHVTMHFNIPQGRLETNWYDARLRLKTPVSDSDYEIHLPIKNTTWQENLNVHGTHFQAMVRLPAPFGNIPLVFECLTGQRLRSWSLGGSYLVLLPQKVAADPSFLSLLANAPEYESLAATDWDGYVLARVEVRVPDSDAPFSKLNEDATKLNLPLFEPYGTPTLHLAGGLQIKTHEPTTFLLDEPPVVKLTGIWNSELTVECHVRNAQGESSQKVSLPVQTTIKTYYFECSRSSEPAEYTVTLNEKTKVHWQTTAHRTLLPTTTMNAHLDVVYAGATQTFITTSMLADSLLRIRAWSFADVVVVAQTTQNTHFIPLTIGDSGSTDLLIRETPLARDIHQPWTLWLTWRNVPISARIQCHPVQILDPAHIALDHRDTAVELLIQMPEQHQSTYIKGFVLDAYPWRTPILSHTGRINDGLLHLSFSGDPMFMQWLLLFKQSSPKSTQFLGIYNLQPTRNPQFCHPDLKSAWIRFIPFLEDHTLPYPLQEMVVATQTALLWRELRNIFTTSVQWIDLNTIERIGLAQLCIQTKISVPLVLCEWKPDDAAYNYSADILTVQSLEPFGQSYRDTNQLTKVERRLPSGRQFPTINMVQWRLDDNQYKLHIYPEKRQYVCKKCHLILDASSEHTHLYRNERCSSRDVEVLRFGRVYLYALIDTRFILEQFTQAIEVFIEGRSVADLWETWLEELFDRMEESTFKDPQIWLKGLAQACAIISTNQHEHLTEADGLLIMTYADSLRDISQKIKDLVHVQFH